MEKKHQGPNGPISSGQHVQDFEIDSRDNGQRKVVRDKHAKRSASYDEAVNNPKASREEIAKERSVKK
jgi:hypothetical protein